MADYVLLAGVRTWYEGHGDGDPLVLLHPGGAGVDARAFGPNLGPLAAQFRVYTPERRGHDADRHPVRSAGDAALIAAYTSSTSTLIALAAASRCPDHS